VPRGFYASLVGIVSNERGLLLRDAFGGVFPLEAFMAAYYARWAARLPVCIPLCPDTASLLQRPNLPRAIATSASRRTALTHLDRAGLRAQFQHGVTRDDVSRSKPAPDISCVLPNALACSRDIVSPLRTDPMAPSRHTPRACRSS
jgi:beta-phosphoglucomutase-like phosphatase (HAD superfamily)